MSLSYLWNLAFMDPMLNSLIVLSWALFQNLGLAILLFTVLVRILMLPMSLRQLRASKGLSTLQPKLQELQQRYGKDRQRLAKEQAALYKEQGVNPLGCLVPTLAQLPIFIGLYQSISRSMATTPENLVGLSQHLYSWLPTAVLQTIPLESRFLWLDLGRPDSLFVLPILVGATTWMQQKMSTMPGGDPRQEATNRMMGTMMPLMLGYMTILFPSGLALYFLASNAISIGMQYFVTGWGTLATSFSFFTPGMGASRAQEPSREQGQAIPASTGDGRNGERRGQRENRRGGHRAGPRPARGGSVRGRGRRS